MKSSRYARKMSLEGFAAYEQKRRSANPFCGCKERKFASDLTERSVNPVCGVPAAAPPRPRVQPARELDRLAHEATSALVRDAAGGGSAAAELTLSDGSVYEMRLSRVR